MPIEKRDVNQIFASQAPSSDQPAAFDNYTRGWDAARSNNGKPTIKQFNKLQQLTDEKILWIHQNGAALPYDPSIEYGEGAVVVKDGVLQQWKGGVWVNISTEEVKKYLLAAGISEPELDSEYDYLMQRLAQIAVDKGWDASFVTYNGQTQQKINDGFSSIAEMLSVTKPKDGMRVFVKGLQGGWFEYNSSKAPVNDGIMVFNGWVRITLETCIYPEWAGAIEGEDSTVALQKCLDYICPTQFDTSVALMNTKKGSLVLNIPATKEGYIITDTLWVGAGTRIEGSGKLSFLNPADVRASKIITDFDDPLKPAISSSNWKTGGVRPSYNEKTSGGMYDSGLISGTNDILLDGFNLMTKAGTRGYMGVRLQNSPRSTVNVSCYGFDYGIMLNACWTSNIDSFALSHKCGLLAQFDNNNCSLNGYYNSDKSKAPLTATNLIDFFTSDTDTDTSLNNTDKTFGFISDYSYGSVSTTMTCEGNDVGAVVAHGDFVFNSLYTEGNACYGYAAFSQASNVVINSHVGAHDAKVYCLGAGAKLRLNSYQKDGTSPANIIGKLSQYNVHLSVPLHFNLYARGIVYQGAKNVIYVSASGNNANSGYLDYAPLSTLDAAFARVLDKQKQSDSTVNVGSNDFTIIILDSASYNITIYVPLSSKVYIVGLAANPTIEISGRIFADNCNLSFKNCNIIKPNVAGAIENAIFFTRTGRNTLTVTGGTTSILNGGLIYCDYNGASEVSLILDNVAVVGNTNSQLVQGNYIDTSPHIVNVVRSRGSISADITTRADKGVSVPSTWQGKVLGLA